jgi:hypothetical protein
MQLIMESVLTPFDPTRRETIMPKKREQTPPEPLRRGPSRPKGSGPGAVAQRFAVKMSPEYRVWFAALATKLGVTESDVFRDAMRRYAEAVRFRPPPIR